MERGKLVIFFGAASGIGTTYAMLQVARTDKESGVDVVVGVVEAHGREDTTALLQGLEVIPQRTLVHQDRTLEGFDLEAALARRPAKIVMDELAHTNLPGSRHTKRWQDVQELLDAGIDVSTTLHVQHLESLHDVVVQITQLAVHETIPGSLFEQADEIRLIDLPPDSLLKRLRKRKGDASDQVASEGQVLFSKGTLIALRELALRQTADHVDAQVQSYRRSEGIETIWPVRERVLVSVSPSPSSIHLVRAACKMATSLRAMWTAVYVETPALLHLSDKGRTRVGETLRAAERMGASTVVLTGQRAADEILRYARAQNITKIGW